MAGDRYGTVVRSSKNSVTVYMDKSHRWLRFKPEILEIVNNDNARSVTAKQEPDESKQLPFYAIEIRRSAASMFGAASTVVTRAGRIRKFASREIAEAGARRMESDLSNDFLTFVVIDRQASPQIGQS